MQLFLSRKVLLVNLNRGRLGSENAAALGALLMGQLWASVQRRATVSHEKRHAVPIYLDEFQETLRLPLDLGDAFAQARGYGVPLIVAHQHIAQLDGQTKAAVFANARSRIVFQAGHDDAVVLARLLGGSLKPEDIQRLGNFETYQALSVNGQTTAPASATTLPLRKSMDTLMEVQKRTAEHFGRPRSEVDDELRARRTVQPAGGQVGARRRGDGS